MQNEKKIRKLRDIMEKRWKCGESGLEEVMAVADAYNSYETLRWVLGESPEFNELLKQAGIEL